VATVRHGSSFNGQHCRIVSLRPKEVGGHGAQPGRCAVVVSKKISKFAVTRNRLKRRFRAALRGSGVPSDTWAVVFPRLTADQAPYTEIQQDVARWYQNWTKS